MIEYRAGMQHIFKKKKKVWFDNLFVGIFNVQSLEIILTEYTFHHLEKKKTLHVNWFKINNPDLNCK